MTGGPSFWRWTSIAIHEPSRAWPPSRTRASIVGPSAAAAARRPSAAPGGPATSGERGATRPSGSTSDGARRLHVAERACGRSNDARSRRKVANRDRCPAGRASVAAATRRLSYDPAAVSVPGFPGHRGRSRARLAVRSSRGSRAPDPPVPRPSLSTDAIARPRGGRRAALRRHRAGRTRRACSPATRPTSSASTCPPTSPATSPTSAIGGRPGRLPRGAPTGRSTRTRIRRSTSTSRRTACPARTSSGRSAGSSPGCGSSRSGPAPASCRTSGRSTGPREDRYKLLRATGVNTSPVVGLYDDPSGTSSAVLATLAGRAARRRRRRRRRRPPPALGRRGRRRRCGGRVARAARSPRLGPGHDRRRPPPLRDGAALPRRAADDAVVRGGPGVRLPADALPRATAEPLTVLPTHRLVRGLGDDGVDGAPGPASTDLFEVDAPSTRPSCCATFEAAGLGEGGAGRFGLWTRDGGALLTARRDGVRAVPAATAAPPFASLDVTLLGVGPRAARRASTPTAVAAGAGSATRSRPPRRSTRVDAGLDGADAAFLLEPTPVAAIDGGRRATATSCPRSRPTSTRRP